ncbi:MAG: C39 family peptidase [Chloroflexi bacterium]|nr:C39 family peptidase [Chloroflexota bacterium]
MKRVSPILLAVVLGLCLGSVLGGFAFLMFEPSATDLITQKYLSLRYRVAEYLPHPDEPEFVPTPLVAATVVATTTPTFTPAATAVAPARTGTATRAPSPTRTPSVPVDVLPVAPSVALTGVKHDYQRWNNCGPTTLEMDLSFFGRSDTQAQIAAFLKPNPDDRNVRPDEMAAYVSKTPLHSIVRIDGTVERLKALLSNNLPVIVETALVKQPQGWMGHYRLLVGYNAQTFNTMDSYDGPNVRISFSDFDGDWQAFNRLYIVVYPAAEEGRVRAILGEDVDDASMYTQAVQVAQAESAANPRDAFAQFNLGMSLNGLKRYAEAAAAFDRARTIGLPWRMMWYQFGPYVAYLHSGRQTEVIALADAMLHGADDLEESHYYKGLALQALGRVPEARREFQAAVGYNKNYVAAQQALAQLK